jgi:hypothetical protein
MHCSHLNFPFISQFDTIKKIVKQSSPQFYLRFSNKSGNHKLTIKILTKK